MSQIIKALFKKKLTLTINPVLTDGITDPAGGTLNPIPGAYTEHKGDVVTITATPNTGYDFSGWDVDGVAHPENPLKVTM